MNRRNLDLSLILTISCFLAGAVPVCAIELMSPATQLGGKKMHAEVYYRHLAEQDLNLEVSHAGSIHVKNSTFSTTSTAELASEGSGNGVMGKITFQPFDFGIQYYMVGGISHYQLSVPSGSYSNRYDTVNPGYVIGGGIKYTLVPYTMVTPAVSIDLSATHSRYNLTRFASGDGQVIGETGQVLSIWEMQGALTVSKRFPFTLAGNPAYVDPYMGAKFIRNWIHIDESGTGGRITGSKSGLSPFIGVKFKPFQYEGLVFEGSLIDEVSASVGLTLGF